MQAIMRHRHGGPEVLELQDVPTPVPSSGQVLIKVGAFGLNHAELYMRRGQWGDVAPISGIECVGTVVEDTTGRLAPGQAVLAAMGGMGRAINGSYAEFVAVRAANVQPVASKLAWEQLAILPESYGTAWSCLTQCLRIAPGQHLLVRGASSSLGRAAVDLAAHMGVKVSGTTRQHRHVAAIEALGAAEVIIAGVEMDERHAGKYDAVLDLLGNGSLRNSLRLARPRGHVCLAGFLAGLAPVKDFNPIADLPSTVQLSFFGSFNFGDAGHALHDIPYQDMANAMAAGRLRGAPSMVFSIRDIARAHALMESGEVSGKLVVVL